MTSYYVPDLRTMASLRGYNSIEDARAYAIKKMDEAGLQTFTVFADSQRRNVVGRITKVHKMYQMAPIYVWKTVSGNTVVYKNGKLRRD